MRRILALTLITGLHLALSLGLLFSSIGATMGRFDDGREAGVAERGVETTSDVFLFPIVNGLADLILGGTRNLSTVVQYLLFIANSFLWAVAVFAIWLLWKRRRLVGAAQPAVAGGRGPRLRSEPRR